MIEPTAVTNYDRDEDQLQRFWVFCILVAGKNSDWAAHAVGRLLERKPDDVLPLDFLGEGPALHNTLVANKVGQYGRVKAALEQSRGLCLRTAAVADLERVFGVGPKTARFFVLHSRPDARCVPLDAHVLSWLREDKGVGNVPAATPQTRREYERLEQLALAFFKADFPHLTVAQADLLVWATKSGRFAGPDAYQPGGFIDDPIA